MTKLSQRIQGSMETHVFKCYCGEGSYLEVTRDDEDGQYCICITKRPTTLRERLGYAWKALRGLEFSATSEVIIDGKDAASLVDALRPFESNIQPELGKERDAVDQSKDSR